MKKAVLFIGLVLFSLLLIASASALERTRIYGRADPNTNLLLVADYTAGGIHYENQQFPRETDEYGLWEVIIRSDYGEIDVEVNYKGKREIYTVPTGQDFEINLLENKPKKVEEKNESVEQESQESESNNTEVKEETEQEEEEKSSPITGKSIFESFGNFTSSNFSIFFIFIGLFVLIVLANLASEGILSLIGRARERGGRPIRVTKLSEKLQEAERIRREEERKKQELREKQERLKMRIEKLKEEMKKLGTEEAD